MPEQADNGPVSRSTIVRMDAAGNVETESDRIAVEEPLEIRLGNTPFVVTMRTPGHDEELAAGFLVSEAVVSRRSEIRAISRCPGNRENAVRVDREGGGDLDGPSSDRHGAIAASCGICGKTSLEAVRNRFSPIDSSITVERQVLLQLPARLRDAQVVFEQTGGLHAAGLFDLGGNLLCHREDVGRHNAVDKVVGHAFLNGPWPLDRHVLLVSGRAAFEIMQKALAARIAIVAAISAPSSLAISLALECGQTLVGFLREPGFNVYAHPQRIR